MNDCVESALTPSNTPGTGVAEGWGSSSTAPPPFGQSPKASVTSLRASSTPMSPTMPMSVRSGW